MRILINVQIHPVNHPDTLNSHQQLSLSNQLANFLSFDRNRDLIQKYLKKREVCSSSDEMKDIFDGSVYTEREDRETKDLSLAMYIDGFLPFDKGSKNCAMTIIMFTLLDLPPEVR